MKRISILFFLIAPSVIFWHCAPSTQSQNGRVKRESLPPVPEKTDSASLKPDTLQPILPTPVPGAALAQKPAKKLSDTSSQDTSGARSAAEEAATLPDSLRASDSAGKKPDKQQIPLICVADPGAMEGSRDRGEYVLTGEVKCQYGRLEFETSRAVWDRRRNQVNCEGGMKVLLDELVLTAETGGYAQAASQVWARGKVRGSDTANQYEFTAGHLTYHRESHDMHLTVSPVLRRFYRDDSAIVIDSTLPGSRGLRVDTLEIRAAKIIYNDSTRTARGEKDVEIIRGNLIITGKTGFFDEKSEVITLSGEPLALLHDNEMKGKTMLMVLDGEEVKSLALAGKATASYFDKDIKTRSNEKYLLEGDSIFINIVKEKMEFIEVFRNGNANHFIMAHPDKTNNMKGKYLRLNFKADKILSASAVGNAGSTYYYLEDGEFKGKNIAKGDSIGLFFNKGKLSNIRIAGHAEGTYLGEPERPDTTSMSDTGKISPVKEKN